MRSLILICALLAFSACSPSKLAEKLLTPQERTAMRGAIDDISRSDVQSLQAELPPALASQVAAGMPKMHAQLPAGPLDVSLLNAAVRVSGTTRVAEAVYQAHGKSGWALVRAATVTTNGKTSLAQLYIERTAENPRNLNSFSLAKAGVGQWAMLVALVLALATIVGAWLRIWRTDLFRRRWLWTLGSLVGVTAFRMNWATGEVFFQPLMITLGASATKQPVYAPWVISFGIPVIALIVLLRPRRNEEGHASVSG